MSGSGPVYRNNQVIFQKSTDELIVAAYPEGVLVIYGWTVSIGLNEAKEYVANFGDAAKSNPNRGFFFHDGKYILSHQGAKMTFTVEEAAATVEFLSKHYGVKP